MNAAAPLALRDPRHVALLAGELVSNRLRAQPALRLALPTGRTPLVMYDVLRAHAADGSLPTERATLFQLEEYVGLGPGEEGSQQNYLLRELDGIRFGTRNLLDGAADDLEQEAARQHALLEAAPLDLAVLGLGLDGHVTSYEPDAVAAPGVRRVPVDWRTRQDSSPGFDLVSKLPEGALAVGLPTLMAARELLLVVIGAAKAEPLRAMLEGPVGPENPASLLRDHPRLTVVCDLQAAQLLRPRRGWGSDTVVITLGHREPGVSAEHVISAESRARLHRAAAFAESGAPRCVILTGWTQTGGLSEAAQMAAVWNVSDVPALLEEAGRNTAENASRCLPIVRALGGVRRVVVISSAWHVRTRYFFAPYRALGMRVSFKLTDLHGDWQRMLRNELRGARNMRRERAAAFRAMRLPPEPLDSRA